MAQKPYEPLTDAEDAAKWRALMGYLWNWPHSPYETMETRALVDEVLRVRDSKPTLLTLVAAARENILRTLLSTPGATDTLTRYALNIATDPTPFVPADAGKTPKQRQRLSAKRRKAVWEADRTEIARKWFCGDEERAEAALDALPYSSIPDWSDLDAIIRAMVSTPTPPLMGEPICEVGDD